MRTSITHAAMDTHKKEHTVAVACANTGELVVFTVRNTAHDIGKMVKKIQRQGQPPWALDIADRAMTRLHKRHWRLLDRGKPPGVVVVALARELAGFLWSVLHEYELRQSPGTA